MPPLPGTFQILNSSFGWTKDANSSTSQSFLQCVLLSVPFSFAYPGPYKNKQMFVQRLEESFPFHIQATLPPRIHLWHVEVKFFVLFCSKSYVTGPIPFIQYRICSSGSMANLCFAVNQVSTCIDLHEDLFPSFILSHPCLFLNAKECYPCIDILMFYCQD